MVPQKKPQRATSVSGWFHFSPKTLIGRGGVSGGGEYKKRFGNTLYVGYVNTGNFPSD